MQLSGKCVRISRWTQSFQADFRRISASAGLVFSFLALVSILSCGDSAPEELPPSVDVYALYDEYQKEHAANPTRLQNRIDSKELRVFEGKITVIEGLKVQFHIERNLIGWDKYVECKFAEKEDILPLNIGSTVQLKGELAKVDKDKVVVFNACSVIE